MQRIAFGRLLDCPGVAAAGGAGIVAAPVRGRALRVSMRDPGGAFGVPARLGPASRDVGPPAAAIAPSGAAVVVWAQTRVRRGTSQFDSDHVRMRILAARRQPGGAFGAPQQLVPWRTAGLVGLAHVAAAIDPAGRVVAAWSRTATARDAEFPSYAVEMATAEPGAAFGPPRGLAQDGFQSGGPELAVAPDGHMLLAFSDGTAVRALERPPGGSRFARLDTRVLAGTPAVAIRSGGGAMVASMTAAGDVEASVRSATGALGAPQRLASTADRGGFGAAVPELVPAPLDDGNRRARVALAPDGGAVVTFVDPPASFASTRPMAAAGSLSGGFAPAGRLGSPLRSANGTAALRLADGRAAVAWTDNAKSGAAYGAPDGDGRVHVAVEGAAARPPGPTPHLRVTIPSGQRLHHESSLRVRVHCDAACDLRVTARRKGTARTFAAGEGSLAAVGTVTLSVEPDYFERRAWKGVTLIGVQGGPPGGRVAARAKVRTRVRTFRPPPFAAPIAVRARRTTGRRVVVTWRTAVPARRIQYLVQGRPVGRRGFEPDRLAFREGRGRSSFRVVLKLPRSTPRVAVVAYSLDTAGRRTVIVPISGRISSS